METSPAVQCMPRQGSRTLPVLRMCWSQESSRDFLLAPEFSSSIWAPRLSEGCLASGECSPRTWRARKTQLTATCAYDTSRPRGQLDEVVGRPVTHRPGNRESASRVGRGRRTRSAGRSQGRAIGRDALLHPAQLPRRRSPLCTRRCPDAERGAIDRADISHAPSTLSDPSMPPPPKPRRNRLGPIRSDEQPR